MLITCATAMPAASSQGHSTAGRLGIATHDSVLLGVHFLHDHTDCNTLGGGPQNTMVDIWDCFRHMPEDVAHISYADFWHWWHEFERYKGDEMGLAKMDAIVDACLERGMKVKIDLAWSTWWTNDKDWEREAKDKPIQLSIGPVDVDDWIHLCDLLARRYRGRIAMWMLQGEANNLEQYWQGASMEHVAEVYKRGYQAFKRVDPDALISIAGASPSVPRQALDEWVKYHATACKGFYDDISMNFFADVADPYRGLPNYYQSIRGILDGLGQHDVEIGSGESSFQWAEDSYKVTSPPARWNPHCDEGAQPALSEEGQAWRCNQSLGAFFSLGGAKFVFWANEYSPGCGWFWRWGLRKYQDWWGIFPQEKKIPGSNIVFGYDHPDGRKVDLRPGWTSAPSDPYHPIWQVYKFWAQAAPPASEAVRLAVKVASERPGVSSLATYLRTEDRCVTLVQNDDAMPISLKIDGTKSGWRDGTPLTVKMRNESIDFTNGKHHLNFETTLPAKIVKGVIDLSVPAAKGFTTIVLERDHPALAAECLQTSALNDPVVGKPIEAMVILKNTGAEPWLAKEVVLAHEGTEGEKEGHNLRTDVNPGDRVCLFIQLAAEPTAGYANRVLRLRQGKSHWFGPSINITTMVKDPQAPRKLVAFSEPGHVRLKWFAPERSEGVASYEVYRADGFMRMFHLFASVKGTEYIDDSTQKDRAYYYRIVALDSRGGRSHASNEDNAKALSKPRIWDAEVVEHTVPPRMRLGETQVIAITLRNTGSKSWDLGRPKSEIRVFLNNTQLWGGQEEGKLPKVDLGNMGRIDPGQTITVKMPYTPVKVGTFENHWILCLDLPGKERASQVYFGTPLLCETVVEEP